MLNGDHFMLIYIADDMIIDRAFLLLCSISQTFLADPIDHAGNIAGDAEGRS